MGLAVLAGGLTFVGGADATELILDGSFENTVNSSQPIIKVGGSPSPGVGGGWSTFSTYLYSTFYALPGPTNCGLQFLRPYPTGVSGVAQSSQTVVQSVSLTAATGLTPVKIDAGQGRFTMSAWFSSYLSQGDYSELTLEFLDGANAVLSGPTPLGGFDFVAALPTGPTPGANPKYTDAKDWGQDVRSGTIPVGARTARVTIQSTSISGSPDGYVDLVSLDVVDTSATGPIVSSANPPDNAISVGPVVNISFALQDGATAVNTNSIKLSVDGALVSPSIQKVDTNTFVQYAAGLLPSLSSHTNQIVFSDNGTPVTTQTNRFRFTVADYLTLPANLGSPLGSEDALKPGFDVHVYQVDNFLAVDPVPLQPNIPESVEFSESVLAGLAGANVADLTGASSGNLFTIPDVINWINSSGATANFPNDGAFPGIPGTLGNEDSFINEVQTFLRFPASGYYQMGINNEDQFRLTAATAGTTTLAMVSPTNLVIPCVAIATNITQLQFGGSLPSNPLTAPVVYGTPSGNPDDACQIGTNTALAGKIVLLDRGSSVAGCSSADIAKQAQLAGAVAVLEITPGDAGFPFRLGDADPTVQIPVAVIAENYGGAQLKNYLTNGTPVSAVIQGDTHPRIAEWNGPKGFGAVDVLFGFAVPTAGVYPMRLVTGHGGLPSSINADLEFFSILPDGTRILVNDTSNPNALLAFRARTAVTLPVMNPPVLANGQVTISWTGTGTLQEATAVTGSWNPAPSQNNPQTVQAIGAGKFYRIQQP